MLIEFRVENHRSIAGEQVFSMEPGCLGEPLQDPHSNLLLVETERQMMACGQEVVIAADWTKFGRLALARLCGLGEITRLVCDARTPASQRAMLEAAGVVVHAAGLDGPAGAGGEAEAAGSAGPTRNATDERTEA